MKNVQFLFLLVFLCLQQTLTAQTFVPVPDKGTKHELGVNLSTFLDRFLPSSNFSADFREYFLIYRKHKGYSAFRFRLGGGLNINGRNESDNANFKTNSSSLQISTATGWEKRKPIAPRLTVNYGLEIIANGFYASSFAENGQEELRRNNWSGELGLQFLGGLQYAITPQLKVGMEALAKGTGTFQQSNVKSTSNQDFRENRWQGVARFLPSGGIYVSYVFKEK